MRKRTFLIGAVATFFLLSLAGSAIYQNDQIVFGLFDKVDSTFWPYQKFLGRIRHTVGRFMDEWNPFVNKQAILSALEVYDLSLSPQDVRYFLTESKKMFEQSGKQKPGANFRRVEVLREGKRYPAQMKLHGDTPHHWITKKKSFQLKFPKDQFWQGRQRWLLIIPEARHFLVPMFAGHLAERLGLPFVENKLVAVNINSVFQGIYYLEEHINEKFLEIKGTSNGVLVELTDNWVDDHREASTNIVVDPALYYGGITYNDHHHTPFNLEIGNLKAIDSEYSQTVAHKTKELLDAIRDRDRERFESLIDIPRVGAIDAWRIVLGDRHSLVGDNNKMVYSLTSGKFFFLPRSEGDSRPLEFYGGSFVPHMNKKVDRVVLLFEMMALSPQISQVRNEWLYYLIQHEKELLAAYDALIDQYLPLLQIDLTLPLNSREVRYDVKRQREVFRENLERIKRQFHYVKAYVNVVVRNNEIEFDIVPDTSLQPITLDALKIQFHEENQKGEPAPIEVSKFDESAGKFQPFASQSMNAKENLGSLFSGEEFDFDYDEELLPIPRHHRYRLVFKNRSSLRVDGIQISLKAALSGEILPEDDVYVTIANAHRDYSSFQFESAQDFVTRHPSFIWKLEKDRFTLKKGNYSLDGIMIVPRGYRVIFEEGVNLEMGPGSVFLSYSPLDILGKKESPVRIYARDPEKPFGTFAIVGDETTSSRVEYVEVSGGSEALLNGIFFSGAFCFYHGDLDMAHATVHHNAADDGLNVKYGKVTIRHSRFVDNKADQIDLDFTQGIVDHSVFSDTTGRDVNGDGLDISGSEMLVRHSQFENFKDKGVSVGEGSKAILYGNTFSHNRTAAAVKDSSHALFYSNVLAGNETGISVYQKKQIFSGGNVYFLKNEWRENTKGQTGDLLSKVYAPTPEGDRFFQAIDLEKGEINYDEVFSPRNWSSK